MTLGFQQRGVNEAKADRHRSPLFFAGSSQDVELAKAMCRGCRARLACLAGALERGELSHLLTLQSGTM